MPGSGTAFAGKSGETTKLSHPVHCKLKFLEFALKIKILEFMTIHMRFEQFSGKHSGTATIADRCAKGFFFELDIVRIDVGYSFHWLPLCVEDSRLQRVKSNRYASLEAADNPGQPIDLSCYHGCATKHTGELAHEVCSRLLSIVDIFVPR